jgi:hypothetical protein
MVASVDLAKYDTDKSAGYLANYRSHLGHLFDEPIKLLELGVQRGGSMLLWRDLFSNAEIAGLDLNRIDLADDSGRIHLYQGFQQDHQILDTIRAEVAPGGFDVIIDDASHLGEYTAASFWHLFPRHLKPGGTYVIEDWSCGYWSHWSDGHRYTGSRLAVGDADDAASLVSAPTGAVEWLRRRARASSRPIAARLEKVPRVKSVLRRLYTRAEGRSLTRRFPSHDYGMVGFVKQLVDACAVDVMDNLENGEPAHSPRGQIEFVTFYPSQVFIRKIG